MCAPYFHISYAQEILHQLMVKPQSFRGHLNRGGQKVACAPVPSSNSVDMFPGVPSTDTSFHLESKKSRHGSTADPNPTNSPDPKQPHHYHADAHPYNHHFNDGSSNPSTTASKRNNRALDAQQMAHEEAIAGHHQVIMTTTPSNTPAAAIPFYHPLVYSIPHIHSLSGDKLLALLNRRVCLHTLSIHS